MDSGFRRNDDKQQHKENRSIQSYIVIAIETEPNMDLTCHKCGFTADHAEFRFLCKIG